MKLVLSALVLIIFTSALVLVFWQTGSETDDVSLPLQPKEYNFVIVDSGLAYLPDSISEVGDVMAFPYYTDAVGDGRVLTGADRYCGGTGQAVITLNKGTKDGRAYNTMLITCR